MAGLNFFGMASGLPTLQPKLQAFLALSDALKATEQALEQDGRVSARVKQIIASNRATRSTFIVLFSGGFPWDFVTI